MSPSYLIFRSDQRRVNITVLSLTVSRNREVEDSEALWACLQVNALQLEDLTIDLIG